MNTNNNVIGVGCDALFGKSFSIRREVLNLTTTQWHILDGVDLTEIAPREWIAAMGGKGGFLTALLNDEEREFVRIVYLPNAIAVAPPTQDSNEANQ